MAREVSLGLEITSGLIRIVETKITDTEFIIENFCIQQIEEGLISDGQIVAPDILVRILRELFQERKLTRRNIVISIPRERVILKLINTFPLPDVNMREIIAAEIEQYAFFADKEPMFTYQRMGRAQESAAPEVQNLIIATDAFLVDNLISVCDKAGLEIKGIECGSLVLLRLLERMSHPELYGFVSIDEFRTDLFVIQEGIIRFLRSFDYGWQNFLKYVPKGPLNLAKEIIPEETIQLRRDLTNETRNSLNFYLTKSPEKKPIENLYVYVGSDRIEGLSSYLIEKLGINVEYLYPSFTNKNLQSSYEVPLSLSLRKQGAEEKFDLNFLPQRYAQKKRTLQISSVFAAPTFAIFIFIFFISFILNGLSNINEKRLNNLRESGLEQMPIIEKKQMEIQEIKKKIDIEKKRRELSKRLAVGLPWSKILKEISRLTPGSIWLEQNNLQERTNLTITGFGLNQSEIIKYVQTLNNSPLFESVSLIQTSEETYEDKRVFKFELNCKLKEV